MLICPTEPSYILNFIRKFLPNVYNDQVIAFFPLL